MLAVSEHFRGWFCQISIQMIVSKLKRSWLELERLLETLKGNLIFGFSVNLGYALCTLVDVWDLFLFIYYFILFLRVSQTG